MKRFDSSLFFGMLLFFSSCDDVFEEDISDDSIMIISPTEGAMLEGNTVQFRWSELEGADDYRIQISGNQQFLLLDSLVSGSSFEFQMDPGTYNWRIRGENFAYVTPFTFDSNFSLSASFDLSNQTLGLSSPENNVYFNDTDLTFTWKAISTADSYHFQLLKREGSTESLVFEDDNVLDITFTLAGGTISEDAEYVWQVRAKNANSSTVFSKRTFFVDTQDPPAPTLSTPTSDQNFNIDDDVNFTWSYSDTGDIQSAISSTIEVSADVNFSTITLSDTNSNGEFTISFTTADTYYWRVKGEDSAGNSGVYSATGSFIVN